MAARSPCLWMVISTLSFDAGNQLAFLPRRNPLAEAALFGQLSVIHGLPSVPVISSHETLKYPE